MARVDWETQEMTAPLHTVDPSQTSEYTGLGEAIETALQTLTHSQRTAVVLNYYHGMRMWEIGEVLGCSESTVRVHLFRGLRRLRKELK